MSKQCEHVNYEIYALDHFTVVICQDCGLRDVRSGSCCGECAYSRDQEADELLSQFIVPVERTTEFCWWVFGQAEFDALLANVRDLFSVGAVVN